MSQEAGGNEMDSVRNYFNTAGFERWNKIYGTTEARTAPPCARTAASRRASAGRRARVGRLDTAARHPTLSGGALTRLCGRVRRR